MIASDAPPATPPNHERQSVSVREAQDHIANLVQPLAGSERVRLFDALDRVLAEDLVSPVDVPPHDNAAMDGFAVRSADLRPDAAVVLEVMGAALAGQVWTQAVSAGQCVRIMTGAMMPAGTDTVVPQELVEPSASSITVRAGLVQAGDNRRCRGEDLRRGDSALQKGELLKPAALGLAASLGLDFLPVKPRLRVAYFSTGDEILDAGAPPRPGAIYDSNRYT
ncbi:MAG: molybdopterin molybdotransferase MoeA, partial [Rhodoferax sp.]|nr:molybdopterin molybdotransferase MoeA [Rhodoferax sp.]